MNSSVPKRGRMEYEDASIFIEASRRERISVGNVIIGFHNDNIRIKDWPSPFYTPFRTQRPVDIKITFTYKKKLPLPAPSSKILFDGNKHWQLFEHSDGYLMKLFETKDESHNRTAIISKDLKTVTLFLNHKTWLLDRMLRPFLEILLVNYLASRQGLLLHGAAIRDGNKAYIFAGESGSGKTTMSQFWAFKEGDISVLGDERLIVRKEDSQWFAYGTPWPGLGFIVANERVPISSVFLIRHGKKHEVIENPKPLLFQKLFSQTFSSFWDAEKISAISGTCTHLISEVPTFELASLKDVSITDFVRDFAAKK